MWSSNIFWPLLFIIRLIALCLFDDLKQVINWSANWSLFFINFDILFFFKKSNISVKFWVKGPLNILQPNLAASRGFWPPWLTIVPPMKTALVFGSSGLIGGHLLNQLIKDNNYNKIKIFVRSEPENNDPKVEIIKTDFNNLENHKEDIKGDDCFFCIGTTKQNSPDKNEYRRVELDVPKEIAQIAKSNSVNSFVFVSSGYADPKSSGDYLKFKGEVEEELKRLNFSKLGIMRPSFLLGDRKEKRIGEKIGIFVFKLLSPLFLGPLKKMKPIHSETVAKAMISFPNKNLEKNVFESNEIAELVLN